VASSIKLVSIYIIFKNYSSYFFYFLIIGAAAAPIFNGYGARLGTVPVAGSEATDGRIGDFLGDVTIVLMPLFSMDTRHEM
jgi:hypothetical protein